MNSLTYFVFPCDKATANQFIIDRAVVTLFWNVLKTGASND